MPLPRVAILDAPTNLGLKPPVPGCEPGVRRLPEALRAHGIVERLNAEDAGRVPAPVYAPGVDPTTGVRTGPAVAIYARGLAETAGKLLDRGRFPLILGGDCSLLLGPMLALRRRGRFGLLFLDGHEDLLTPETSQSKGAAGMDLALACGIGPASLTTFDGLYPLVRPADVIMLGDRSGDTSYPGADVKRARAAMSRADSTELRRAGVGARMAEALARLRSAGVAGVWVHLDADVLDNAFREEPSRSCSHRRSAEEGVAARDPRQSRGRLRSRAGARGGWSLDEPGAAPPGGGGVARVREKEGRRDEVLPCESRYPHPIADPGPPDPLTLEL